MVKKANEGTRDYSYLMTAGHLCCDLNQSMVPALLPFLVAQRGLSNEAAAGLVFASSSLSSLVQPLLGMISDKHPRPRLMAIGILTTGIGIASIGFLNSYWGIFAMIMIAGLGSAIFHPEGGRMASCVAGSKKGRAISNFTVGGNIGYAVGPLVATGAVSAFGLSGTVFSLIPTILMVIILQLFHRPLKELSDLAQVVTEEKKVLADQKDDWKSFIILCLPIFTRSIVSSGIHTFIPLYWMEVLGQSQEASSLMVTIIALASAVTAFIGGRLADRYGFRRIIRISFACVFPLVFAFLMTKNVIVASILVILIIAANQTGHSPSVVLGQGYLPGHMGLASGMTIGFAVSVGGMCSPLLGKIGDDHGLSAAMYVVAGVALIGFILTLFIKKDTRGASSAEKDG